MSILAFILATACPQTKMINKSKLPWVGWDYNRMHYCQKHCRIEYPDAVCLKRFIKLGYQNYYAECGKP
jgi:hypothetical protein